MSVKPILFSAPMVRGILAGRKTQTRRALKPQPVDTFRHATDGRLWQRFGVHGATSVPVETRFAPGDLLYVRETWKPTGLFAFAKASGTKACSRFAYQADSDQEARDAGIPWKPSIHMPRWASRITLAVENVRVERLQEISEANAIAEGVWTAQAAEESGRRDRSPGGGKLNHIGAYASLWEDINGPGAWAENPWVVAITFRPLIANVDAVLADPAAYGIREAA